MPKPRIALALVGVLMTLAVQRGMAAAVRDQKPATGTPAKSPSVPIAPLTWPILFPAKDSATPTTIAWAEDAEITPSLQLRIVYPTAWKIVPKSQASQIVSMGSPDGSVLFSVGSPGVDTADSQQPMTQAKLDAFTAFVKNSFSNTPAVHISAVGQASTAGRLWLWTEMATTMDSSSLPTEPSPLVGGLFDRAVEWNFTTTSGGRMVVVSGMTLHRRGQAEADFQQATRDAGAIFSQMLQRIVIEAR
jgi:hypothetical protein